VIGDYAGAILIVAGFCWLLLRLQLAERSKLISGIVRQSVATTADRSLSDDAKAKALRRHSLALFGIFARLTLGLALAVGLPILLVWLIAFTRLWSFQGAIDATLTWPFLVAGLLPFVAIFLRSRRRRES
jgi:hypothetical protein